MFQRLTIARLIFGVVAVGCGAQVFAQRVYWTTDGGSTIERSVAGSFATEVLLWPLLEWPRGIALDVDSGKVYWTSEVGLIQRCNFDGTALETVVENVSISPHFLALDLGSKEVYWTDDFENKIFRVALNAPSSSVTELVALPNGLRPEGIALDHLEAKIYWASTDLTSPYDSRIQASDIDGSNVHDVIFIGKGGVGGLALNTRDGYFVWSHWGPDRIERADFGSTTFTPVLQSPHIEPIGIAIAPAENAIYWVDIAFDQVRRTSLDDGSTKTLVQIEGGNPNPYDIALDLSAGKMYWSDYTQDSIRRADLDGSRVETVIERITYQPLGIALNPAFGHVYWLDLSARRMYRADLNGTNAKLVLETPQYPMDVKIDVAAGKAYWVTLDGALHRANLDGTELEFVFGLDSYGVSSIALDLARGKIYWNDSNGKRIRRANFDGSDAQDVIDSAPNYPLGLALDQAARQLYWIESVPYRPGGSYLRSSTLDGKDPQTLADVTDDSPAWIALDPVRGNLYLGGYQSRNIRRASLDGMQVEIVATASNYYPARGLVDACERDGPVKLSGLSLNTHCLTGPGSFVAGDCYCADLSGDARVDLLDFAIFQRAFSGE